MDLDARQRAFISFDRLTELPMLIILAFGIPGLMAEWALGRHTRRGTLGAFERAGFRKVRELLTDDGVAGSWGPAPAVDGIEKAGEWRYVAEPQVLQGRVVREVQVQGGHRDRARHHRVKFGVRLST